MLTVIRTKEGKSRWLTTSSTHFKDRDKEIVSEKALVADVERADADGDYGPLRWWHVKGLDIGTCDFNEVRDGMLIESGTFHNEAIARAVEKEAPNLGVSIGFTHPADQPDAQGVFHDIRRYERSLLPLGSASNPYTTFSVKEKGMAPNTPERAAKKWRAFVDTVFQGDEDSAKAYAEQISARAEEIKGSGVAFKETREKAGDDMGKQSTWIAKSSMVTRATALINNNLTEAKGTAFSQPRQAVVALQTVMAQATMIRDFAEGWIRSIEDRTAGWKESDAASEKAEAWDDMKYREPALASVRNALEHAREVQAAIVGFHGIINPNDYRNMSKASWDKAVSALNEIDRASDHATGLVGSLQSAMNSVKSISAPAAKKEARPTRVADRDPLASLFAGEGAKEVEVVESEKAGDGPKYTDLNQVSDAVREQETAFRAVSNAGGNGDWDAGKAAAQRGAQAANKAQRLWSTLAGEAKAMAEVYSDNERGMGEKARGGGPPEPTDLNDVRICVENQRNIFNAIRGASERGQYLGAVRLATEAKGWAQKAQRLFSRVVVEADAML